jgi:Domain of unknown function (DUF4388)
LVGEGVMQEQTLKGNFERETIPSLLQYLGTLAVTGELTLISGSLRPTVYLERGRVIDAIFGARGGQEALFHAMNLISGTFTFTAGVRAPHSTIDSSLESLILNAAYWQDTHGELTIGATSVPKLITGRALGEVNLNLEQWQVLTQIDGRRTIAQIGAIVRIEQRVLERVLHGLQHQGLVEFSLRQAAPVDPKFMTELRLRLASVIGPVATAILSNAASEFGTTPERLEVTSLRAFVTTIVLKLPETKRAKFRDLAQALLERHAGE